jgi:ABC-type uncharacterized transport system permease subunit
MLDSLIVISAAIFISLGWSQLRALKHGKIRHAKLGSTSLLIACLLAMPPLIAALYDGYALRLELLNVLALIMVSSQWVILIAGLRQPTQGLSFALGPITALALFGLLLPGHNLATPLSDLTPGLMAHILLSVLAYSFLTSAAIQAILTATQNRQLHNHNVTGFSSVMPPLQTMETILFSFLWAGFIILSAAIATGFIYVEDLFAQHLAHKTAFSILAWCFYAGLLVGHYALGWRGQRATTLSFVGYGLLLLAYVGSQIVLEYLINP